VPGVFLLFLFTGHVDSFLEGKGGVLNPELPCFFDPHEGADAPMDHPGGGLGPEAGQLEVCDLGDFEAALRA
jgi:hypothetical protein